MKIQVGPCTIDRKVNGDYLPIFTAAEAMITLTPSLLYRVNDGMKVGRAAEAIDIAFEITTLAWSITLLKELGIFDDYTPPDSEAPGNEQYHTFKLYSIFRTFNDMWLRFKSVRPDISSIVEIPHACLEGDVPVSFMYGQGDISTKGQALKVGSDPLIILQIATGVQYITPDPGPPEIISPEDL